MLKVPHSPRRWVQAEALHRPPESLQNVEIVLAEFQRTACIRGNGAPTGEVSKYWRLHFSVQCFNSPASPTACISNLRSALNACVRDGSAISETKGPRYKQDKGMFTGIVLTYPS